jgi:hypothetical protein
MQRWQAERLGLLPVTIVRCHRAFEDAGALSAPHFLFMKHGPGGLREIFSPQNYMRPNRDTWTGAADLVDERGEKAWAFWPQWL